MIFSAEASVYYGPVALRLLSKSVYFVIVLLVRVDKVCGVTADNHKPLEQSLGRVCSLGSLARENRLACVGLQVAGPLGSKFQNFDALHFLPPWGCLLIPSNF